MQKEDKIVIIRGIIGVIAGVLSFLFLNNEIIAFLMPLIAYIVSIFLFFIYKFDHFGKWDIYGRGVLILFSAWILIFLILYNV
ncbi:MULTISPECIES: hypothetical protein [Sulfurisphaera]|uniref:Uncharacterized protein n=3 Tax=Sulfurisphaera TaxID=69655 RepID=Q976F8_SULTO|nr:MULTISPECIES: hypothetical protein [Sulfurisphaera]MBB5253227.1 hypothetical protein [Sulfurisphaera ohwakuensis]QGR15866.1 hypothetical protein D1869_00655 [Sulfurisphaera ohwakuensis]BAB65189.1 hypothetical protein STK_02305 [Sulfurisphaera tokodaii str. 7]HII74351.1 hypothetical protein [Sulfurisphaera tokodaii]